MHLPILLLVVSGLAITTALGLLALPLLIPVRPLSGLRDVEALRTPRSRFVTLPVPGTRGLRCHYLEAGSTSTAGRTFLLLHGFTFNAFSWNPVLEQLGGRGRAIAYDRFPFGLSDKPLARDWSPASNPYNAEATLGQMQALIDSLGLRRPVLIGNSAGGLLAAHAVLRAPTAYAGLILVCPAIFGGPRPLPDWIADSRQMRRIGPLLARNLGRNKWLLRRSFHDASRVTAEHIEHAAIATGATNWDAALWEYVRHASSQPRLGGELHRIRIPTLIVGGAHDRVVAPADYPRIAALIPGAELAILPDAGHLPQLECTTQFLAVVEGWIDRRL